MMNGPLPDIRTVIGADTPLYKVTDGELAGPCPKCGGTDRFHVSLKRNLCVCSHCHDRNGHWLSAADYVMWRDNVSFPEAKMKLDGSPLPPPPPIRSAPPGTSNGRGPIVTTYNYVDEAGEVLYQVCRHEPKTFSQRRPNPEAADGWIYNLEGTRRVLYRLPALLAEPNRAVWIVEGEKDADTIASLGLLGTTNAGGATNWRPDYTEALAGRHVIILPDQDSRGAEHAAAVQAALSGKAASCVVVDLPAKDISDWIAAGGTRAELEAMVKEARRPAPIFPGEIGADELDEMEFEPVRAIVPSIIYEGAMLFAGAPKSGKSITMLGLAAAVATGGVALGKIRVERMRVLYFSLEEPRRLTQKRLRLMLGRGRLPKLLRLNYTAPPLAQLLIDIERYIEQYPDTGLVVIDTLTHARGPVVKQQGQRTNLQQEEYHELIHFSHLAQRLHIAIVILSHTNKSEHEQVVGRVAGSYGLSGAVDGILLLERKPKSSEATLNVISRELGSDIEHEMHWDPQILCYTVEGPVQEGPPKSDSWKKIMAALASDEPMSIADIVTETGMPESTVKPQIMRMLTAGDIDRPSRGVYSAKQPRNYRNDRNFTPENGSLKVARPPSDRYFDPDSPDDQSSESIADEPIDIVNYRSNVSEVAKVSPPNFAFNPDDPDSF